MNEGTFEKRGKTSWRLIASMGYLTNGKQNRKRKTVNVKTPCDKSNCDNCPKIDRCSARKEARKKLNEFIVEVERGEYYAPASFTFKEFAEKWIKDYGEDNLAPKTLYRYKEILTSRVYPAIGHIKLHQIKPLHLVEFYKNLQEDGIRKDGKSGGLSKTTITKHHAIISSILKTAVKWEIISSNPADKVRPPKKEKYYPECYDETQTGAMLTALDIEPLRYRTIIILALATGLRRGEIMGLEWTDIDFQNKTIEVRQTSQYIPKQGVLTKAPKTEGSRRLIAVSNSVIEMLKEYKAHQATEQLQVGDLWKGSKRLFVTWDGQEMHPDTISTWFSKFLERHDLPHIRFHDLRHLNATLLIKEGVPLKSISKRLGHSNISTTGDIYAHALRSVDQEAADKLDIVFSRHINPK